MVDDGTSSPQLRPRLEKLKQRLLVLSNRLQRAAIETSAGTLPQTALASEIDEVVRDAIALATIAKQLTGDGGTELPASIQEFELLVTRAESVTGLSAAHRLLDQGSALQVVDGGNPAILEPVVNFIARLRQALAAGSLPPLEEMNRLHQLVVGISAADRQDAAIDITATWGKDLGRAVLRGQVRQLEDAAAKDDDDRSDKRPTTLDEDQAHPTSKGAADSPQTGAKAAVAPLYTTVDFVAEAIPVRSPSGSGLFSDEWIKGSLIHRNPSRDESSPRRQIPVGVPEPHGEQSTRHDLRPTTEPQAQGTLQARIEHRPKIEGHTQSHSRGENTDPAQLTPAARIKTLNNEAQSPASAAPPASKLQEGRTPQPPPISDVEKAARNEDPDAENEAITVLRRQSTYRDESRPELAHAASHSLVEAPGGGLRTPPSILSFDDYRSRWRLGMDLLAEPAPWLNDDYPNRVARRFESLLAKDPPHFGQLWLLAAAGSRLEVGLPPANDIEELAHLWFRSPSALARGEPRSAELNGAYEEHTQQAAKIRWKLALTLEALTPSIGSPIPLQDVDGLVEQVGFDSPELSSAIAEMLRLAAHAEDPITVLRPLLGVTKENPEQLLRSLAQRRSDLMALFNRAQHRKLFRFETEFCQKLWISFLAELRPHVANLFPDQELPSGRIAAFLPTMERSYIQLMDGGNARHQDRRRMDRAVSELFDLVREIEFATGRLSQLTEARTRPPMSRRIHTDAFRRIAETDHLPTAPEDQLIWRLLRRCLGPTVTMTEEAVTPLALRVGDLCSLPPLLGYLPSLPADTQTLSYKDLAPVREAASFVITGATNQISPPNLTALVTAVRGPSWSHLLTRVLAHLSEAERVQALQAAAVRQAMTQNLLQATHRGVLLLRAAASPLSGTIAQHLAALEECLREGAAGPGGAADLDGLAQGWLVELGNATERELGRCRDDYMEEARSRPENLQAAIQGLLRSNRFAEALAILRGNAVSSSDQRVTAFRYDASVLYAEPLMLLRGLEDEQLANRWTEGLGDLNQQRSLRTVFAKLVFGRALYERADKPHDRINIPADAVRAQLAESQLNPSYVPQLARISFLVVPGVGSQPSSPKFVQNAADTAGSFCSADASALVILLLPRVTRERRGQLLAELRKRRLRAAVIDDLDLCRITNPGGERRNMLLGLLEIVLEQQSWRSFSPFELVEGQHVQMEMYVGRAREAQQLALQPQFTRLFSGRKLGKSALLRFVEKNYDNTPLPSRRTLRVLYVSAVGVERGAALADTIVTSLIDRMRVRVPEPRPEASPFDRLRSAFRAFHDRYKDSSLLVVLDEADVFVEAELEEYQREHERCLSFLLRSRLDESDSQGLPYVRFLFTGYRVTNTREGAWANWGDVLRLSPLPTNEAADLISGPLARLGIDAQEQAPVIAYQCGHQPAVLLRFGERLVAHLDERFPGEARDRVRIEVGAADVAQVAEDDAVVQEIRTVVKNNFYGNEVGRVVYYALLREFLTRGAGSKLESPEELLVARLSQLSQDAELGWLRSGGSSVRDELRRQIEDLVDRQLLARITRLNAAPEYGLRFPHHLPILAPLAREDQIRDDIARLTATPPNTNRGSAVRGLLSRGQLAKLSKLMTDPPDYLTICPIFAWPTELTSSEIEKIVTRGLFDQLGAQRYSATQILLTPSILNTRGPLAILGTRPDQVDEILASRDASVPSPLLAGGLDLSRAVLAAPERRTRNGRTVVLDLYATGRISLPVLGWWFKLARGFEFSSGAALQLIIDRTGGIPVLVVWIYQRLIQADPGGAGLDVTDERLSVILRELEILLGSPARSQFTLGLTETELRLLRMIRHSVLFLEDFISGDDLEEALSSDWHELRLQPSKCNDVVGALREFSAADLSDKVALDTLVVAGYLPRREIGGGLSMSVAAIAPSDPVFGIF